MKQLIGMFLKICGAFLSVVLGIGAIVVTIQGHWIMALFLLLILALGKGMISWWTHPVVRKADGSFVVKKRKIG